MPHRILGILIGLTLAIGVGWIVGLWKNKPIPPAPVMSETDGEIREIDIQYVVGADFTIPIYREFLTQFNPRAKVYVVCPEEADFAELKEKLGISRMLAPIYTHHPQTPWAKDRWIALFRSDGIELLASRGENLADAWPTRKGDEKIAFDIASALGKGYRAKRGGLFFDGGDILADGETVFVSPWLASKNIQKTVADEKQLDQRLEEMFRQRIVRFPAGPEHHTGMFMVSLGHRRAMVGDPSMAKNYAQGPIPESADYSAETQAKFDAVAKTVESAGYCVTRIPVVPSTNQRAYVTYCNSIIDIEAGKPMVYMPVFDGWEALNEAGKNAWETEGFEVRKVNCTTSYAKFGNIHCLVNVLRRG
jgi:hypothetical protein